jgi:hypothetical protein
MGFAQTGYWQFVEVARIMADRDREIMDTSFPFLYSSREAHICLNVFIRIMNFGGVAHLGENEGIWFSVLNPARRRVDFQTI